jgi:ribosome-associated heat shock protein Hsp15
MDKEANLRIDRWLFYCRFYKTRVLASAAVSAGHVKLNNERATPGQRVRRDDRIQLVRDRLPYLLTVVSMPPRRGPTAEAQKCYVEDAETVLQRQALSTALRQDRMSMPRTSGHPDKHTRRMLRDRKRN